MSEPELARDATAFMRWCVSDWTSDCEAIRKALVKRRVWRSVEEWRISTETEESIESSGSGFAIVSSCDATWRGAVPSLDEALKVRMLFWSFHVELFYSLGWPSWAAANRMEADEPGARMRNGDARPTSHGYPTPPPSKARSSVGTYRRKAASSSLASHWLPWT